MAFSLPFRVVLVVAALFCGASLAQQQYQRLEGSFSRVFGLSPPANNTNGTVWYTWSGPFLATGVFLILVIPILVLGLLALCSIQAPDRFLALKNKLQ